MGPVGQISWKMGMAKNGIMIVISWVSRMNHNGMDSYKPILRYYHDILSVVIVIIYGLSNIVCVVPK